MWKFQHDLRNHNFTFGTKEHNLKKGATMHSLYNIDERYHAPLRYALLNGVVGTDAAEVESLMEKYVDKHLIRKNEQETIRGLELDFGMPPRLSYGLLEIENVRTSVLNLDDKRKLSDAIVALVQAQLNEALAFHILKIKINEDHDDSFEATYAQCKFYEN